MGDINRLQLETREVGRGRTALGAAGAVQRAGVQAAESAAQNVLVASTLATQAIQEGRADLQEATSIIKEIDEKYGKARRKAAAQQTVTDSILEADERVQALFNNPDMDPLQLAAEADKTLLDVRNTAGGQAARLGPEEQQFVLSKLDALRATTVAKARQEGYRREGDQQRANFEDISQKIRLKMYNPATPMAERVNLLNDLLVATENFSFHLGEANAEKIRNKEILGFKRQAFIEEYLVNPNKALEQLPLAGFPPEEEAQLRARALSELERLDRKERQAEADAERAEAQRNDEMFNLGTVGAISLDQLRAEAIKDPSLAPSLRKLQTYTESRQRHRKVMAGEGAGRAKTQPGVMKALFNKILRGEYESIDQVIEETDELFLNQDLSESDAINTLSRFQSESKKQKSEKAKEFNLEIKGVSNDLTSIIAPVNRVTGKRNIQSFNLAKNLEGQIIEKGIEALQENKEPNTGKIVDEVIQENLPTVATTLEGKTLKDVNGVFASVQEAEKAGVTGEELERIRFQDKLIKAAAEQNAKTEAVRQEAQRLADAARLEEIKAAERKRIGEETFKAQEEARVARETEQVRRQTLEEKLLETPAISTEKPGEKPRFRAEDGKFVRIDDTRSDFDRLVDEELNRLHGDNIKNVDRNTLKIQRDRISQSLKKQRAKLIGEKRREERREEAEQEAAEEIQARKEQRERLEIEARQKLDDVGGKFKQLNQARSE